MTSRTLVLTSWYFPHRIVTWEAAVTLVYLGKVDVLVSYDEEIRSPSTAIKMPAVVRLKKKTAATKRGVKFSRMNIYVRDDFACAAAFYGGRMKLAFNGTTTPFDRLAQIACPLIGFYGNDDTDPSPADVDAISAELTKHGKPHEFHRYDGAGHAFENFTNPDRYRPRAAAAAWGELLAFFGQHLRVG